MTCDLVSLIIGSMNVELSWKLQLKNTIKVHFEASLHSKAIKFMVFPSFFEHIYVKIIRYYLKNQF